MTRLFVELPSFRNDWRALGLADGDLRRLQEELLTDPQAGRVMQGTGGIRKIRFAYEMGYEDAVNGMEKLKQFLQVETDKKIEAGSFR